MLIGGLGDAVFLEERPGQHRVHVQRGGLDDPALPGVRHERDAVLLRERAIRSISVMPPQRVTSGWIRSTWPRSISSRKPQRVASCSPAAIVQVDGVGELGVGLVLVRLERLLEPVDAELLELARDADRGRRVGDVAEPGVDQDLDAVAAGLARGGGEARRRGRGPGRAGPSRA